MLYGFDKNTISEGEGTSGATGTTKTKVNHTLTTLKSKGVNAEIFNENFYHRSSVSYNSRSTWVIDMIDGFRDPRDRSNLADHSIIRCSLEF